MNELKAQLVTDHVRVQVDTHGPDMSELLRDIRSQYESAAKKNREEAEAWYNSKVTYATFQSISFWKKVASWWDFGEPGSL